MLIRPLRVSLLTLLLALGGAGLGGCQNDAQTGALIGAAVGSAAGAAIDHRNRGRGALIGAGVGGAGGYVVGNERDKSKDREEY